MWKYIAPDNLQGMEGGERIRREMVRDPEANFSETKDSEERQIHAWFGYGERAGKPICVLSSNEAKQRKPLDMSDMFSKDFGCEHSCESNTD